MSNLSPNFTPAERQLAAAQLVHATLSQHDSVPESSSAVLTKSELAPPHNSSFHFFETPTDEHSSSRIGGAQGFVPRQRSDSDVTAEIITATAVSLPQRLSVQQPTTIRSNTLYPTYAHGAPLSDIGEEELEIDPITTRARKVKVRTPSPHADTALPVQRPRLKNKSGLGNMSSSGDSDCGSWEEFDTSKLGSDRVAADIVEARESLEIDEDVRSKRNSRELDEELAALNDRAEKILESARKRLTHMEDNLTKARHSMLLTSTRSIPNMHDSSVTHKPAGGLYRSISQNNHKRRSGFPVKPSTTALHVRTGSDNIVPSGMKRLSKLPDVRPASALDFARSNNSANVTPETKYKHISPASSRSFNSPLRALMEESSAGSPSAIRTSPDLALDDSGAYQGLGIYSLGATTSEVHTQSSRDNFKTPRSIDRPSSQASMRSARDLNEKMTEMRSRINELKTKAHADSMKRRSMQSLRNEGSIGGHSPSTSVSTDRWQPTAPDPSNVNMDPEYDLSLAPERTASIRSLHQRKDSALSDNREMPLLAEPITPVATTFLATDITPMGLSSARTDRNTPNLVSRFRKVADENDVIPESDASMIQTSCYEDIPQVTHDENGEVDVAANEEEQIYLNEVLEESLQEAEPEVPIIPAEDILNDIAGEEGLSHEDRLDAFDYENMFLHSAMGSYMGKTESEEGSDNQSIETSRQDIQTPTLGMEDDEILMEGQDGELTQDDEEIDTDEEMEAEMMLHQQSPPQSQIRSPLAISVNEANKAQLQAPRMPWTKVSRSNSMESASSNATFQTATEGAESSDHEMPEDIINWGNPPVQGQRVYIQPKLPIRAVHIKNHHSSPHSNESVARVASGSQASWSPTDSVFNSTTRSNSSPTIATSPRPRSASGQYRIFPTTTAITQNQQARGQLKAHTRTPSNSSSVKQQGHKLTPRNSTSPASSSLKPTTKPSVKNRTSTSPPVQSAQSHQSQFQTTPFHHHQHNRSISSSQFSTTSTSSTPSILGPITNTASTNANTTILMESLIKLADPSFALSPSTRFEELDKELVLGLLRAVGAVGSEVLRSQARGDVRQVGELRGRLGRATGVLIHGGGAGGAVATVAGGVTTAGEGRALDSGLGFQPRNGGGVAQLQQRQSP